MSTADRRRATALLKKLKFGKDTPISVKLKRCMREYFTVEVEVDNSDIGGPNPKQRTMKLRCAYNYQGHYAGDPKMARMLAKRGITPELADPEHTVCSIGRSHKDGRWYGWSHRAMAGFKVGNRVKEGDCVAETIPVGFQAADEDDKRALAVAFAASVS